MKEKLSDLIKMEINKLLESYSQKDLIHSFKNKPKNKQLMIRLKNNKELVIFDLEQIDMDEKTGFGADEDGKEIEFKFSDVKSIFYV